MQQQRREREVRRQQEREQRRREQEEKKRLEELEKRRKEEEERRRAEEEKRRVEREQVNLKQHESVMYGFLFLSISIGNTKEMIGYSLKKYLPSIWCLHCVLVLSFPVSVATLKSRLVWGTRLGIWENLN